MRITINQIAIEGIKKAGNGVERVKVISWLCICESDVNQELSRHFTVPNYSSTAVIGKLNAT